MVNVICCKPTMQITKMEKRKRREQNGSSNTIALLCSGVVYVALENDDCLISWN